MNDARTTTLIRKPAGRKASDAGRSRLGDLTRPIAREHRIAPNRKPAILLGIGALVVAGAIGAALFGLPVRTWFGQDAELRSLDEQLDVLTSTDADLQSEVDRLQTPAGIIEAARDELGLIQIGEVRETVANLPLLPTDLPDGWPYSAVEAMIALRATPTVAEQPTPVVGTGEVGTGEVGTGEVGNEQTPSVPAGVVPSLTEPLAAGPTPTAPVASAPTD